MLTKPSWILLFGTALLGIALILPSATQIAGKGDGVTISYTLTLEDRVIYDSSSQRGPLNATLGEGTLLPDFEAEVIGMRIGDTKTFTLPPEKAYGNYRPELIGTFDRSRLPEGVEPEIGKQIQANLKDSTQAIVVITSFTDTTVTLDANHPLAGRTLTFDIQLVAIGNNTKAANPNQTMLGWLVLALGVALFVFLNLRNRSWPWPAPVRVMNTTRRRRGQVTSSGNRR